MSTLKEFVESVAAADPVEPFWLTAEATERDEMNGRYREVLDYMDSIGDYRFRAKLGIEPCTELDCGGVTRAVETRSGSAFRVDACCTTCGKSETHRAGWLDREVRDAYRASVGSKAVG